MNTKISAPRRFRNVAFAAVAVASVMVAPLAAHASPVLVNGSFESTNFTGSYEINPTDNPGYNVTGWTVAGDPNAFLFTPGSADTTGAKTPAPPGGYGGYFAFAMWGPGNGSNNGLTATSPDGGNFVSLDGNGSVISQTVTGLTVGESTTVSFYFAGAQMEYMSGATTEQLEVSLGGSSEFTPVLDTPSEGFTGWNQYSMTFTPTSTSEVLSFLSIGTPGSEPPAAFLDGVSVTDNPSSPPPAVTPEPSSLALLGTGLLGLGGMVRTRFKSKSS